MEHHNRTVPRTASQLIHFTDVHLWCITSCDLHMDADLVATHQTSPATIAYTFFRDCMKYECSHTLLPSCSSDLWLCEWLLPTSLHREPWKLISLQLTKYLTVPTTCIGDLLSSRLMEAPCYNVLIEKYRFYPCRPLIA